MVDVAWLDTLNEADTQRLHEFLLMVHAADGRPEVAEGLPKEFAGGGHIYAEHAGELAGYAHLDSEGDAFGRQVGELFVRPDLRRQGVGAALLSELLWRAGVAEPEPGDRLRVWSHGDHPAAVRLAERFGMTRAREMHRMRRDLAPDTLPDVVAPSEVRIRPFVPGQDEEAFLRVNARAFAWHPEQGALDLAELRETELEPWFDPAGFLLAERDGELLGFHWTKVHPQAAADASGKPMGEVYVIGVDPDSHGGGLGKALTLAGLHYLTEAGLSQVMLYVESDNPSAIGLYRKLGFDIWDTDVQYAR